MNGVDILLGLGSLALLFVIAIGIAEGFMMFLGFIDERHKNLKEIQEEKEQLKQEIERIEHDA